MTINFFLTAICILVISNHNSFRVLSDKIAYVGYVIWKYIYSLALKTASPWTMQYCINCRLSTHFRSLSTEAVAKQQQLQQQKHCAVTNLPASVVTSWRSTPLSIATRACNRTAPHYVLSYRVKLSQSYVVTSDDTASRVVHGSSLCDPIQPNPSADLTNPTQPNTTNNEAYSLI